MPLIVLTRRGCHGSEMHAVPLGTFDEVHVLQPRRYRLDGVEHMAQHGRVLLHVLHAAFAELGARAVEGVGDAGTVSQSLQAALSIEQIGRDVAQTPMI